MNFFAKFFNRSEPAAPAPTTELLQLACGADLWCRKRTSISTMLDPGLYDLYKTNDDRIDEDWIIQSNPPCAFKVEFPATEPSAGTPGRSGVKEGCDALLALLSLDPGLHATKGWLNVNLPKPLQDSTKALCLQHMAAVVRTAERELKTVI